jgi:triosephosphate isomerase
MSTNGAFTGEISAEQLKDFGINWTIIGHSERRSLFGETNEVVAKKSAIALENDLNIILCIGEKLEHREGGKTNEILEEQLNACKDSIKNWSKVVIAYEPVWAIGTGVNASPEQAQETHESIRKWLNDNVSDEVANATRIIYGGKNLF